MKLLFTRPDFNCFSRDNILKVGTVSSSYILHSYPEIIFVNSQLLSQTYWHFCAPVFQQCNKYTWFAAGYVDTQPRPFVTPTDHTFNEVLVEGPCQGAAPAAHSTLLYILSDVTNTSVSTASLTFLIPACQFEFDYYRNCHPLFVLCCRKCDSSQCDSLR